MKEKITEQSIQLFEKKGFSETSVQDIVDSIGVTKGTFYYYFSSKEELLMDIHLSYIDDMLMTQEKIVNDHSRNCKNKLFEIIYILISKIKTQGPSARVFFREMRNLNEERLSLIIPKRDQFRENIEKVLQEGKEKGELKSELNIPIVTFAILGVTNWSYQWFNPEGAVTDHEVAEIFTNMILQGIEN
ncbi:TetR/AcrR family transcriptional regulator [Sutcliffiella deserti]|uniref:TetR/AcrR family transcriptional regulator n=1 Tax=Sutcliffiella deserti TaxID=2875501 RepID=UPI001CBABFFE|nr:TetR/AcrR family transcriptional regulator [Sutcliffiella deserti]